MSATTTAPPPTTATAPAAPQRPPLWPKPIPVVGLTGEKWSGKTIFGLSIAGPDTLIYDTELSSLSYIQQVGATRVDVMEEMHRRFPSGHKPVDRYLWWLDHVHSQPTGRYRVIMLDTVNEIDTGLTDWVRLHPQEFGHTAAQYVKMSGIMWGDVKDHWLNLIASDLKGRCETFVFVTHMGDVWGSDNKPTGKRKPKGKDTLFQVASLYLQLERKKDSQGNLPQWPAAVVLKDRVSDMHFDAATGEMAVRPLLPPRFPKATPAEVRRYMLAGGLDMTKLRTDERAPEETLTDDDRAAVQLATAEAVRDAEQAKLARLDRETSRQAVPATAAAAHAGANGVATAAPAAPTAGQPQTFEEAAADQRPPDPAQLAVLARLRDRWMTAKGLADDAAATEWQRIVNMARPGATSARQLTARQAEDLIAALGHKLDNPGGTPPPPFRS